MPQRDGSYFSMECFSVRLSKGDVVYGEARMRDRGVENWAPVASFPAELDGGRERQRRDI